jgi:hypothetical protein
MCWTKRGAHLLLKLRCALLERFQRWFPSGRYTPDRPAPELGTPPFLAVPIHNRT